jgi:hypothetical protein
LKYLDLYSNGISLWSNSTKNLAGDAFTFDGSTLGAVIDATNVPDASINEISDSYANLCVTLSRTVSGTGSGAATAYDYFVNKSQIEALPTGTVSYPDDGINPVKVVVTNGNYDIVSDSNSTVHVVIASGNVTVTGRYSGLILAGGNVTLNSDAVVAADRSAVADALQALLAYDDVAELKYYMYLNPEYISPMNVSSTSDEASEVWDMNTLVIYENWKKNET